MQPILHVVLRPPPTPAGGWGRPRHVWNEASRQDSAFHRRDYLLSVGPLFGDRSISEFAVELANCFFDDPCFDFVDHVLIVHVSADALVEPFAYKAIIAVRMYIASNCDDRSAAIRKWTGLELGRRQPYSNHVAWMTYRVVSPDWSRPLPRPLNIST